MANRLVDTGRKYGMEINIDKSQVMRITRRNESLWIVVVNREPIDHILEVCNKSWLMKKGNQDRNLQGQRRIYRRDITLEKHSKYLT